MTNPPQPESQHTQSELQEQTKERSRSQGSARTHHCIPDKGGTRSLTEPHPPAELKAKPPRSTNKTVQPPNSGLKTQSKPCISPQPSHGVKRRTDPQPGPSSKRSSSCGLEPVVAPSTKPWPVFTIAGSIPAQSTPQVHRYVYLSNYLTNVSHIYNILTNVSVCVSSPASAQRPRTLQARTIIQQCTHAKVKIKPALDGADAQWAEVGVCLAPQILWTKQIRPGLLTDSDYFETKLCCRSRREWSCMCASSTELLRMSLIRWVRCCAVAYSTFSLSKYIILSYFHDLISRLMQIWC